MQSPAGPWSRPHRRRRPCGWHMRHLCPFCGTREEPPPPRCPWACAGPPFPVRGRSAADAPPRQPPARHRCRWYSRSAAASARCGRNAQTAAFRRVPFRLPAPVCRTEPCTAVRSGRTKRGCSPAETPVPGSARRKHRRAKHTPPCPLFFRPAPARAGSGSPPAFGCVQAFRGW